MDPKPWDMLLKRTYSEQTDATLFFFTSAAENVSDPASVLDRLVVVWMWQLKAESPPFHELCIAETEDILHGNKTRRFILERVYRPDLRIDRTEVTEVQPTTSAFKH